MSEPQNENLYRKTGQFRNLVRMVSTNIPGDCPIILGLSNVRGIGRRLASAIILVAGIPSNVRIGMLSDETLAKLEEIARDPIRFGIPEWMVNRQHDIVTGKYRHVVGTELDLVNKQDIDRMREIKSWKGIRHNLGLKVNGQRTRCTGRHGLLIGYLRKQKKSSAPSGAGTTGGK